MARARFDTLDAFRGIAALGVTIRHVGVAFDVGWPPGRSYLAVDLFFLLSGFVIAHRYDEELRGALSPARFVAARWKRLLPMYALGTLIGAAVAVATTLLGTTPWPPAVLLGALLAALVYLPIPVATPGSLAFFPLNGPAWSLCFEMVANALYALLRRFLSEPALIVILLLCGGLIATWVPSLGSANHGHNWDTIGFGLLRVTFSFFAGAWLYRHKDVCPRVRVPALPLVAIAGIVLTITAQGSRHYDTVMILLVFPILLLLGARTSLGFLGTPLRLLGAISYPLYAIHSPLTNLIVQVAQPAGLRLDLLPYPGAFVLAFLLVAAWLSLRLVDAPAQRLLTQHGRRHRSPATSSIDAFKPVEL